MKLEDVANISIGILTSREKNQYGEYEYKIFNLKNYDEKEEYEIVKMPRNLQSKLTKKGDILIKLIYPNRVIYIGEDMENLLVPSQMCLIRVDKNKANPQFLKWYLESDIGRQNLLQGITGSIIPKISVSSLRKIEIPKISIEKQNETAELIELWGKEKRILEEIINQKDCLYNNMIMQIVEKEG